MAVSEAIARRYAQAYFDLAQQAKAVDPWGRELARVAEAVDDPEVSLALANPRLRGEQRAQLTEALLEGTMPQASNLVRLLLERGRIAALPQVVAHYRRLADRASGVVRAEVITAIPVDQSTTATIERTLSERLGGAVETSVRHDPGILGGLVVRIGDRVIDGSVRTRLQQLRAALT
jgi:F-type H+-transporting ATPase subunit delta